MFQPKNPSRPVARGQGQDPGQSRGRGRGPTTLLWLALVAMLLLPTVSRAHPLPGSPTFDEQLQDCEFDLFRARRADTGDYFAGVAREKAAQQLYPHLFVEAFKQFNRLPSGRNEQLARRLAPSMLDLTLDLGYQHMVPRSLGRNQRLVAIFQLLLAEADPEALGSVASGLKSPVQLRPIDRQVLGAIILSPVILDVYDKVAWGPAWLLDHKMPTLFDSNGWNLDGVPISTLQYEALYTEVQDAVATYDETEKVDLMGGVCLHAHPLQILFAPSSDSSKGAKEDYDEPQGTFDDVITVLSNWYDTLPLDWLISLGDSGQDSDAGTPGGSTSKPPAPDDGSEEPYPDEDPEEVRRCASQCGLRPHQIRALEGCRKLGEGLGIVDRLLGRSGLGKLISTLNPAMAIRNCEGSGIQTALNYQEQTCMQACLGGV